MNNKNLKVTHVESKYYELDSNKPLIFSKKVNNKSKVIPLKVMNNNLGQVRHFPPAAQEWFNSVYTYNNNYIKLLPTADKTLMNLVKSYFNFYFSKKVLKAKRLPTRFKRLSVKKIFVGKGELKHTSSKVIITLYIYNKERSLLMKKIKKLLVNLFFPKKTLRKYGSKIVGVNKTASYNRYLSIREYLNLPNHYNDYISLTNNLVDNVTNNINETHNIIMDEQNKEDSFNDSINFFSSKYLEYNNFEEKLFNHYLKGLKRYKLLLDLNKIKFEESFLSELSRLISNVYNKEVEFNIVNLKKLHLNSDIFTQAVSLKLRNRNNKLYRVLKSSLSGVKLPNVNREKYNKGNKELLLINEIKNQRVNSLLNKDIINNDPLNTLLSNIFPLTDNLQREIKSRWSIVKRSITLKSYILKSLKHMNMAGIRIEAKGRLTRRFTASRSVFKMKWKGGLKNIDSSFKGLSAVMLRGHAKSNIQYSNLNSKNRNGAFGVKGWVSSNLLSLFILYAMYKYYQ